jgi:REP element-mobilizing transposase RayT
MARPLRIIFPGAWYHVTSRGQERRPIYLDDRDREHFLKLLEVMVSRFRVRVHAYVLMDNHYHLLLETPEANLSRAIQWINVSYAAWFNCRHRRSGHLTQGRFKAILVEQTAWALEVSVYVHLNPVRVAGLALAKPQRKAEASGRLPPPSRGMVTQRLEVLRKHRWSSFQALAGYARVPAWLTCQTLWQRAGGTLADYRALVEDRLKQDGRETPWAQLTAGLALGTQAFLNQVRRGVAVGRETEGKRLLKRRRTWAEVVRAVETIKGEPWSAFAERHGDPGRAQVYAAARDYAGLTLAEIGLASGGADYAAVGVAIRRLGLRRAHDAVVEKQWHRVAAALEQ